VTMRRFISILIITGAVLAAAQVAVADLVVVPITVTSQTLRVSAFSSSTEDVGGSSVVVPFSFGAAEGSTAGTVSSVLTDGELIITVDGALSNGGISGSVWLSVMVAFDFELTAPNLGAPTTPIYLQTKIVSSEIIGAAERNGVSAESSNRARSQLLGGLVNLGYISHSVEGENLSESSSIQMLPGDTFTFNTDDFGLYLDYSIRVPVMNETGVFTEVIAFRAFTSTPVPEPSASLAIPPGAAMLFAIAKLRGASLIR